MALLGSQDKDANYPIPVLLFEGLVPVKISILLDFVPS
jgi:hypothetical protein